MGEPANEDPAPTWFVRRGGQVRGPLSSGRVRHFVLEGRLQLTDEVSRDRVDWRSLGQVTEVIPLQFRRGDSVDSEAIAAQHRRERGGAMRGIAAAVVVVALGVAAVLWYGERRAEPVVDCAAAARPGVDWRNCHLQGLRAPSVDLARANLANVTLSMAVLNDARLSGADLSYADLSSAGLSYAALDKARLLGADLRGVDLTHADLRHADLGYADLTGALLGGADFTGARLDGAIWTDGRKCAVPSAGACR